MFDFIDTGPIWLTLKLATTTSIILVFIALPLAWWLVFSHRQIRHIISALVTMPLILPPTVLGFYLLVFLGPHGLGGQISQSLGLGVLPFTFAGLVIASVIYSLPFAVQPIQNAFLAVGKRPLEVATTLGASPLDTFFSVIVPLSYNGMLTALILSFAHTMGEFGVVLMIGGNIPGETRVLSMAIYDHVESQEYRQAHILASGMFVFAFFVLLILQWISRKAPIRST